MRVFHSFGAPIFPSGNKNDTEAHIMKKNSYLFLLISFLLFCAWPMEIEASNVQDDIFYHILVDRFNNGDRDRDKEVDLRDPYTYHGGDFAGIIERLDTIKITALLQLSCRRLWLMLHMAI